MDWRGSLAYRCGILLPPLFDAQKRGHKYVGIGWYKLSKWKIIIKFIMIWKLLKTWKSIPIEFENSILFIIHFLFIMQW